MEKSALKSLVTKCLNCVPNFDLEDVASTWRSRASPRVAAQEVEPTPHTDFEINVDQHTVVLRVRTTRQKSMSGAHLEVSGEHLLLRWDKRVLDLTLPCAVRGGEAAASFSRKKQLLVIRVPAV